MNEIGAFLDVRCDERELLLEAGVAFAGWADRIIEQEFRRLMLVAHKVHHPQGDQRAFVDIEPQAIAGFDGVAHADLGVAVLAIKELEEKSGIIAARRSEAVIIDRRDLLLQLGAQLFLVKSGLPVERDDAGALRLLFLLFLDGFLDLVLLLRLWDFDGGLREGGRGDEGDGDSDSQGGDLPPRRV